MIPFTRESSEDVYTYTWHTKSMVWLTFFPAPKGQLVKRLRRQNKYDWKNPRRASVRTETRTYCTESPSRQKSRELSITPSRHSNNNSISKNNNNIIITIIIIIIIIIIFSQKSPCGIHQYRWLSLRVTESTNRHITLHQRTGWLTNAETRHTDMLTHLPQR